MEANKPLHPGMLTNFVTATRPVTTEDAYGELLVDSVETVATFWAYIKETRSLAEVEIGKKRITRRLEITARERDIEDIDLDDILTFGNSDDEYQVNDIFEADWRFGRTILAEYKA